MTRDSQPSRSAAMLFLLACGAIFGVGCSNRATGALLDVCTDDDLGARTGSLCVRRLGDPGSARLPNVRRGRVALRPSGSELRWTIEITAYSGNNCDGTELVSRIVTRSYVLGQITESQPHIILIDPCEGQCSPPRTTCIPCDEFTRAGEPPDEECVRGDLQFVCRPPDQAPFVEVPDGVDASLPVLDASAPIPDASRDASLPLEDTSSDLDAPGLDAHSVFDAFGTDATGPDAHSVFDAFVPADVFEPPDATEAPDAVEAPDAPVSPDAFVPSCLSPNCVDPTTFDCVLVGRPCSDSSGICRLGACRTCAGCQIPGVGCVANETPNPSEACQVCDADANPEAWSNRPSGTICSSGPTFRSCSAGVCRDGCQGCVAPGCAYPEACCPTGVGPRYSCAVCSPDVVPPALEPAPPGTTCLVSPGLPGTCDGATTECRPE